MNVIYIWIHPYKVYEKVHLFVEVLAESNGKYANYRVFKQSDWWHKLDGVPTVGWLSEIDELKLRGEIKNFLRENANEALACTLSDLTGEYKLKYDQIKETVNTFKQNFESYRFNVDEINKHIESGYVRKRINELFDSIK